MNTFTCTNCDRTLPTADAICTYCKGEFSLFPITGRYSCPNCTKRFKDPALVYSPVHAKWYQPQLQAQQCPHCQIFLRDKMRPVNSWIENGTVVALWLIVNIYHPPISFVLAGAFILLSIHLLRWRRAKSSVWIEEERYATK